MLQGTAVPQQDEAMQRVVTRASWGDVLLPALIQVLLEAGQQEEMDSWGQTAVSEGNPTSILRNSIVYWSCKLKISMDLAQPSPHPPKKRIKVGRQIFLSNRLIHFSSFLSQYINFVYKLCYSELQ